MIGAAPGVSSLAAAIVIYMTVIRATEGEAYVLPYVIASVALLLLTAALAALSSLTGRVESLERDVKRLLDDDYEVAHPTEYEMGDDGGAPSFAAHL